jgi:uncharacterized protein YbcV (DUF1398 family)
MFTLEQINELHDRYGSASTFHKYAEGLAELGVIHADTFVSDGHSEYFGAKGHTVTSPAVHDLFLIADSSSKAAFEKHLRAHEQGKTSYLEMSRGLADSGVEKWVLDTKKMTLSFVGTAGEVLLSEEV